MLSLLEQQLSKCMSTPTEYIVYQRTLTCETDPVRSETAFRQMHVKNQQHLHVGLLFINRKSLSSYTCVIDNYVLVVVL